MGRNVFRNEEFGHDALGVLERPGRIRVEGSKSLSGGLRANRVGTGPLAISPSNMVVWRGHSAARTVATVSL